MFDRNQTRKRLLGNELGLTSDLARMRDAASDEAQQRNPHFWRMLMLEVAQAYLVGLGDDERVREMTSLIAEQLRPEHVLALKRHDREQDTLFEEATAQLVHGLARWLLTAERPAEVFGGAATAFAGYHELVNGTKSKWRVDELDTLVMLQCMGNRVADLAALAQRPQLAVHVGKPIGKARSPLEIGLVWASENRVGVQAAAQRVFASFIRKAAKGGGFTDIVLATYFTALVRSELPRDVAGVAPLLLAAANHLE